MTGNFPCDKKVMVVVFEALSVGVGNVSYIRRHMGKLNSQEKATSPFLEVLIGTTQNMDQQI